MYAEIILYRSFAIADFERERNEDERESSQKSLTLS
jgi:hypothetical protein